MRRKKNRHEKWAAMLHSHPEEQGQETEPQPCPQNPLAGADLVGDATLVASILESKGKEIDFNRCLAHPDMMKYLVVLGKILGPKGLMPNPKVRGGGVGVWDRFSFGAQRQWMVKAWGLAACCPHSPPSTAHTHSLCGAA